LNNSIKYNFGSEYNLIKQKRSIALLAIWIFVLIAVINVYLTNDQYLIENSSTGINSTISYADNRQNFNQTNNDGQQNYALVQYNKKLILTRFTGIISQPNSSIKTQNQNKKNAKGQGIIVIKNQRPAKPVTNNEFSVKPIPQ
jgi:hypothetical protein